MRTEVHRAIYFIPRYNMRIYKVFIPFVEHLCYNIGEEIEQNGYDSHKRA
jgi:hypothetical protein